MIDNEMQRLVYFGILKKDMPPYSSSSNPSVRSNFYLKIINIGFIF